MDLGLNSGWRRFIKTYLVDCVSRRRCFGDIAVLLNIQTLVTQQPSYYQGCIAFELECLLFCDVPG